MLFKTSVATPSPSSSLQETTAPGSTGLEPAIEISQQVTKSMMLEDLKKFLYHLAISLLGVAVAALLQGALNFIASTHPEFIAGASQLGAAYAAVRLLGQ